jgi:xanthine dehydrogenase small subunit
VPEGTWARTLRTTWVEPAYLEPDAAWCAPGGDPAGPLANGGAFGGKVSSAVGAAARRLADEHGRAVRVLYSREDTVALGPKRPPLAVGIDRDGRGVAHVVRPAEDADRAHLLGAVATAAPGIGVRFVDVPGPPVSSAVRAATWAELTALRCTVGPPAGAIAGVGPADTVIGPSGAEASAAIVDAAPDAPGPERPPETVHVQVRCGRVLDEVVLRSYCVGAAHMALGMVRSEFLALGHDGTPRDLTIRSFGVLRAADTPRVEVLIVPDESASVNGSDAVFAAVLAAAHRRAGTPDRWPLAAM